MNPRLERNLSLLVCAVFILSAFGFAAVASLFIVGLIGWALAVVQTLRFDTLRSDPDQKSKSPILDIMLTALITIFLVSAGYSVLEYYRDVGEVRPWSAVDLTFEHYQMLAYTILVQVGGWTLSWVQSVRRVRLNMLYATAGKP